MVFISNSCCLMTWHSTLSLKHGARGPIPKLCSEQSLGGYKIAELLAAPMIRSRGRNSRGLTRKTCVPKKMKTKVEGSVVQHYLRASYIANLPEPVDGY